MEQKNSQRPRREETQVSEQPAAKRQWQEPKLAFIKPKLTKHGELKEVTAGFFGGFSPGDQDAV
jgi:hypothetical protein